MSDPERHGLAADTAPKVRGKRFRESIARLLADVAGRLESSYADLKDRVEIRRELGEALEREKATSQVLGITSSSPSNLEPVFEAMLANATRLCEANLGILFRYDGTVFRAVALQNVMPEHGEYLRRHPPRPDPRNAVGRLLETKQPVHIVDVTAEPAYAEGEPSRGALVEIARARTFLAVPMLKDDELQSQCRSPARHHSARPAGGRS